MLYEVITGELIRTKTALDLEKSVLEDFISQARQEKEVLENRITSYNVCYTKLLR